MSINRKKLGALLGVVAIGIAVASPSGAARQSTPGVTSHSVTIGGTFPLTGGASLYKTITYAEQAYFAYVNAHGGVNHRQIIDKVEDDQYNPSITVTDVKDLVENKHVFAIIGSLGTEPAKQTMDYLNSKGVPQALLATGDAYWGLCAQTGSAFHPIPGVCTSPKKWTMGWQPDYPGEAFFYAKYVLAHPPSGGPKIGILYQNDDYGKNYLAGFMRGLGTHKSYVVDKSSYNFGDSAQIIGGKLAAMEGHGDNTVVLFSTPTATIQALATMGGVLHWSPLTFLNNVSANRVFLLNAEQNGAKPGGVISSTYIKSQTTMPNDQWMQKGHDIIYATGDSGLKHQWDIGDNNLVYGLAVAWTFVDALKHAGTTPTRASFMHALRTLNESGTTKNPFVYPGIIVKTNSSRTFPMQQLQLQRWNGSTHDWKTTGGVFFSGH